MPDKGIHISEDVEQAAMDIEQIFGGVRFDRDGEHDVNKSSTNYKNRIFLFSPFFECLMYPNGM